MMSKDTMKIVFLLSKCKFINNEKNIRHSAGPDRRANQRPGFRALQRNRQGT
jgi:hypothetical protein